MTTPTDGPTAELLSIGSELLAGETTDTNAAFLGAALARLGIPLRSTRHLPDETEVISAAFAEPAGAATWWWRPAASGRPTTT